MQRTHCEVSFTVYYLFSSFISVDPQSPAVLHLYQLVTFASPNPPDMTRVMTFTLVLSLMSAILWGGGEGPVCLCARLYVYLTV